MDRAIGEIFTNEKWAGEQYFLEWSRAILSGLKAKRLYLLVDETKIKDRVAVMMAGLAFESRCIPLVWRCYKANSHQHYPAGGQVNTIAESLSLVQRAMPGRMEAVVLADRGIGTSPTLCKQVNLSSSQAGTKLGSQRQGVQETGAHSGACPRHLG